VAQVLGRRLLAGRWLLQELRQRYREGLRVPAGLRLLRPRAPGADRWLQNGQLPGHQWQQGGDYVIHNPLLVGVYASWYSDGVRVDGRSSNR